MENISYLWVRIFNLDLGVNSQMTYRTMEFQ